MAYGARQSDQAAMAPGGGQSSADMKSFEFTDLPCSGPVEDKSWLYVPKFETQQCGKNTYLGLYGQNSYIQKNYTGLKPHNSVFIQFKAAATDDWKSDTIQIIVDYTIIAEQAFDSTSAQASNICAGSGNDLVQKLTGQSDHTADTLSLIIRPMFKNSDASAAWGICDLEIHFNPCPVNTFFDKAANSCKDICGSGTYPDFKTGMCADCDSDHCLYKKWKEFSCDNPLQSDNWGYVPGFKVAASGSNNFVGAFGPGGIMASYYTVAVPHQSIKMSFLLHLFGQWNNNKIMVLNDGDQVYEKTFDSSSPAEDKIAFHFNHNIDGLRIAIKSDLAEGSDASWGVCDLQLILQNCTYQNDTCIDQENIASSQYTAFDCKSMKNEDQWNYTEGYKTLKCSNSEMLGTYTTGTISRILPGLHKHQSCYVKANLGFFGTWGDSEVIFKADGNPVYQKKSDSTKSDETCDGNTIDSLGPINFEFAHNATQMLFEVTSNLQSDAGSWGICGLEIYFNYCPIGKYYHKGVCVVKCPKRCNVIVEARTCEDLPGSEESEEESAEKNEEQAEEEQEEQSEKENEESKEEESNEEKPEQQNEEKPEQEQAEQATESPETTGYQPSQQPSQQDIPYSYTPSGYDMNPSSGMDYNNGNGGNWIPDQNGGGNWIPDQNGGGNWIPDQNGGGNWMPDQSGGNNGGNNGGNWWTPDQSGGNNGGNNGGNWWTPDQSGGNNGGNNGGNWWTPGQSGANNGGNNGGNWWTPGQSGGNNGGNNGGNWWTPGQSGANNGGNWWTPGQSGASNGGNWMSGQSDARRSGDDCVQAHLVEGRNGLPASVQIGFGNKKMVVSQSTPYSTIRGPRNEQIHVSFVNGLANVKVDNGRGYVQYSKVLGQSTPECNQGTIIVKRVVGSLGTTSAIKKGCDKQIETAGGLKGSNKIIIRRSPANTNVLNGAHSLKMGGTYRRAGGINLNVGHSGSILRVGKSCGCEKDD